MSTEILSPPMRKASVAAPGDPGIWTFLAADVAMFGIFFLIFVSERAQAVDLFEQSRRLLDPTIGMVNTLFLLTSSWFMVGAAHASRRRRRREARRFVVFAFVAGFGFGALKLTEYGLKIGAGITMLTNDFFTYYFIFTGVHFLHFAAGMIMLALLFRRLRQTRANDGLWTDSIACYWHMVDLLWLMLFPMLYLMRS